MILDSDKINILAKIDENDKHLLVINIPKEYREEVLIDSMENRKLLIIIKNQDPVIMVNKYTLVNSKVNGEYVFLSQDWCYLYDKIQIRNEKLINIGL